MGYQGLFDGSGGVFIERRFLDVFKCFKLSCSAPLFKNLKRFESTFILFKKRLKVNVEEMSKKQLNRTKIVGYL